MSTSDDFQVLIPVTHVLPGILSNGETTDLAAFRADLFYQVGNVVELSLRDVIDHFRLEIPVFSMKVFSGFSLRPVMIPSLPVWMTP